MVFVSCQVREEQKRKEDDAAIIAQRRAQADRAKQSVHDAIYAERRVSPDRVRILQEVRKSKSPKKKAVKAGLAVSSAPSASSSRGNASPYRIS